MSSSSQTGAVSAMRSVVESARFELIPLKNLEPQIPLIPTGTRVSVTCSPAKGQQVTLDLASRLADLGHDVVPHLSARLVTDRDQLSHYVSQLRTASIREVFLVAGDAEQPAGAYDGVVALLRDLLELDHGFDEVGVTAYPDGHPLISDHVLRSALRSKQELLGSAGVRAHASTQMCFDTALIRRWIGELRNDGISVPIHLGVPGVVDRTKLMTLGLRLGIGQSLRYVSKNRRSVKSLLTGSGYDPSTVLDDLDDLHSLGIAGLHVFTFNEVQATLNWQRAELFS